MSNFSLKMVLASDTCPASGDGFAGYVDTDICFDDQGLPYIPGKRVKGYLRECGLDIISVDESCAPVFYELFGETGKLIPGALKLGNGRFEDYEEKIAGGAGNAHASELAEVFTAVRSRTKIDKFGKASPGSLRTARVLLKGQVYIFPVELPDDAHDFFEMCVKSLRGIGLNRSRGLGEVVCSLLPSTDKAAGAKRNAAFDIRDMGETCCFSYKLKLMRPVICAHRSGRRLETEDYIFGSAILGAFALKYIEKYGATCGFTRENAYQDPVFRRLFLDGGVIFTAAMPYFGGTVYQPAPLTLMTDKSKSRLFDETLEVYDAAAEAAADADAEEKQEPIAQRLGGFAVWGNDGKVKKRTPAKTTFTHHARPADKGYGHASEAAGEFYAYEALSEGQSFIGSVCVNRRDMREKREKCSEKCDIEVISDLFGDTDTLYIGRSRTAQYGLTRVTPEDTDFATNKLELSRGDMFRLVAVTPIVLEDAAGVNRLDPELIVKALGADLKIIRYVCAETVVSGYYGKWLLPKRQLRAVAEGSVVAFEYTGSGVTLKTDFIGERTGEGFGQIRLEKVLESDAYKFAQNDDPAKTATAAVGIPAEVKDLQEVKDLKEVIDLKKKKKAIAEGIAYGDNERFMSSPKNANLTRVLAAFKRAPNYAEFARLICDIKQPKQKIAALVFATGKDNRYFKADPESSLAPSVAKLLAEIGREKELTFDLYKVFLNAAARRVMQKRRAAKPGTGGTAHEN